MRMERSLLGSIFLDNSAYDTAHSIVAENDFESVAHQRIYRAMGQLLAEGAGIDYQSVHAKCPEIPVATIAEIADTVPSAANAKFYAKEVHAAGTKRNVVRILRETLESVSDMPEAADVIEYVESRIFELSEHVGGEYHHVSDYLLPVVNELEERAKAKREGRMVGVASGLAELDHLTGGFRRGELIVIGARASIGKTALGLTIASNVSEHVPCAFFSLEMSGASLTERLIAMRNNIHMTKLRNGVLDHSDFQEITKAAEGLQDSNIWIYDVANARLSDIKSKARRLVARQQVEIIVVDYVGQIKTEERFDRRHDQIGHCTRELKQLARELQIPVILLAQLNRQAEGKVPGLSDLAESGNIEQDSDVIVLLHRDRTNDGTETLCSMLKARNGATGVFKLAFLKQYTKFVDLEKGWE